VDALTRSFVAPLLERAALTQSLNEGWLLLAGLFALGVLLVPLCGAGVRVSRR
jgi:hypothetical protein